MKRKAIGSGRRYVLLGGPGGYMTVLPAGDPRLEDGYVRTWTPLLRMNVPRRLGTPDVWKLRDLAGAMKQWALDVHGNAA